MVSVGSDTVILSVFIIISLLKKRMVLSGFSQREVNGRKKKPNQRLSIFLFCITLLVLLSGSLFSLVLSYRYVTGGEGSS